MLGGTSPPPRRRGWGRSRSTRSSCARVNDDQAPELLAWAIEHGYHLRFIEQMPLDAQHGWSRAGMVTADEILARLERRVHPRPGRGARGAPAELFLVDGGPATVG